MSDPLSRLQGAARPLLAVVDEALTHSGAPGHHPIWPLLRSIGLRPGEAVTAMEALAWEDFRDRAEVMRSQRERAAGLDGLLAPPSGWEGAAADAAGAKLESARAGVRVLAANAGALADLLGRLAEWGVQGRMRLARTLAKVITSAQAVELAMVDTAPVERAWAAADIGAEVLAEVAAFWAGAREIVGQGLVRLEQEPTVDRRPAEAPSGGRMAVEF